MGDFDGKVALVTGGGSGIGRATALGFAGEGAKVVIGNRSEDLGEKTAQDIRDAGGEARFQRTDVTSESDVEALVKCAVSTFGGLDVAFNNAGVEGKIASVVDQTEDDYQQVMDVNVKGVWLSMKYEIPEMLGNGGGAIVNCSSAAGVIGFPGLGVYVASKHAVVGLTKSASLEYSSQGVRINSVNPAVIETGMSDRLIEGTQSSEEFMASLHPIGRIGQVEEVAQAVLWLCAERASFVTGHSLMVDGGFVAQ